MRIVDRWWQQRRYETVPLYVSAVLVLGYGLWTGAKIVSWTSLAPPALITVEALTAVPGVAQKPDDVETTGSVRP